MTSVVKSPASRTRSSGGSAPPPCASTVSVPAETSLTAMSRSPLLSNERVKLTRSELSPPTSTDRVSTVSPSTTSSASKVPARSPVFVTVAVISTASPTATADLLSAGSVTSKLGGSVTVTVRMSSVVPNSNSPDSSNEYTYVSVPDSSGSRSNDTAPTGCPSTVVTISRCPDTAPVFSAVTVSSTAPPSLTVVVFQEWSVTVMLDSPTTSVPAGSPLTVTSCSPFSM